MAGNTAGAPKPAPPAVGGDVAAGHPRPVSFAQAIANNLASVFHLTAVGVSGFLGSFKIESGFNPHAYNPGENAHGIAQWEGGRWSGPTGLQAFASSHHLDPLTPAAQIGYLDYELTHSKAGVIANLRGVTSVDQAAQIVQSQFEGSSPDSLPARTSAARGFYAQLAAGRPLTGGPSGVDAGAGSASFGNGPDSGPPPSSGPYKPSDLRIPLTPTQRARIKTWLTAQSMIASLTGGSIGATPAQIAAMQDGPLLTLYSAIYALKKTQNNGPLEGNSPITAWVRDLEDQVVKPAGRAILDGLLIIGGLIAVLVAVIIISRAGGRSSSAPAPTNTQAPAPRGKSAGDTAGDILDA